MSTSSKSNKTGKVNTPSQQAFQNILGKENYYIIGAGVLLLIIGYFLMSGGQQAPDQYNENEIYSFRRITLAPIVVILGYIAIAIGIMYRKKNEAK